MQEVKVKVEGFTTYIVHVSVSNKKAQIFEEINYIGFSGSGVVGEDNRLIAVTNDISTNYLECAMVKALQHCGVKVQDIKPYPLKRKIKVVK